LALGWVRVIVGNPWGDHPEGSGAYHVFLRPSLTAVG
jgi:hypothetical protein